MVPKMKVPSTSTPSSAYNIAPTSQSAQAMHPLTRHHPDKPCEVLLLIGEPSGDNLVRALARERLARDDHRDLCILVLNNHESEAFKLVEDTLTQARRDHEGHKPQVLVLRCDDRTQVDLTRLPLQREQVRELLSGDTLHLHKVPARDDELVPRSRQLF
jgi:hypothetical protein